MNDMILERDTGKRMTSLEISELVESRHDKVKQSIERLAKRGVIELPPMGGIKNHLGQVVSVYFLNKRSSLIVVAQLSPEFTARVVDRWQELEAQVDQLAYVLPTNFKEALLQLVEQVEVNERLQLTLIEQQPKVALADKLASAQAISVDYFVKSISGKNGIIIGRNNFYAWMRKEKLVNKKNLPFQEYIDAGWFEVRESTYENSASNGPRACFTTLITGHGQVALFERLKKSPFLSAFVNKAARLKNINNNPPEARA